MTDAQMWSLIVGAALPPLIAILQQPKWSKAARAVVTLVVCVVAGFITCVVTDVELDFSNARAILTSILIVLVTALTTYRNFWKQTGVAPAVEAATSNSARTDA